MKKLLFATLFCFHLVIGFTQSTYNRRIDLGFPAMFFTNIECQEDTCFVLGVASDSFDLGNLGTLFLQLGNNGTVDTHFYYFNTGQTLTGFENNMRLLSSDSIIFLGTIETELPLRPWFVRLNKEGDILDSNIFKNVQGVASNYVVGRNWFTDSIYTYITYGFLFNNAIGALAIDKYEGDLLKEQRKITYGDGNWHESLLQLEDKWILGVRHVKNNLEPNPKNRIYQCALYSIDKNMQVTQEWISPPDSNYFAAYDLLEVDDDEYVVATLRYDKDENFGDPFVPWVIRVNTFTKEILWSIDLGLDIPNQPNASTKLLFNLDSTAVFITGQQFEIGILNERPPQVHGFLSKVNMDGELQWIRRYLGTEGSQFPDHKILDAALLADGSIIMVGESTDLFFEEPPGQRGWLLKVDSFGCLVPGCQLVSTEPYEPDQALDVRVYPNPVVSDQVWVYIADDRLSGRLQFSLFDMQGRQVQQWSQTYYQNSTYLLDIPPGLATGAYILRLEDDQGHFWQEKLMIGR